MNFTGFDPVAVGMLDELPLASAEDYAQHKALLAAGLTQPGLALVHTVADTLDADLTVSSRGSVSPLHRDLRFASAGSPRYKDHLLLTTWEGSSKRTSPILWIRIDASRVGWASGIGFTPTTRERWRTAVGGDAGADLDEHLRSLGRDSGAVVAGEEVKRVPAPFDADHPRADLLRKTGFQVRYIEPLPACATTPDFVGWCADRLSALLPVHRWLVHHLGDR